jgi:hypothetical protein
MRHPQTFGEQPVELVAEPLAPMAQVRTLVREGMLEKLLAGEVLKVDPMQAASWWPSYGQAMRPELEREHAPPVTAIVIRECS